MEGREREGGRDGREGETKKDTGLEREERETNIIKHQLINVWSCYVKAK